MTDGFRAASPEGDAAEQATPTARRWVGQYGILRQIGRGGMAIVYLARQETLDRDVALKELSSFHASSPEMAQRFLREARLAGALNHPNVVTVFEHFQHGAMPYIAMEYVRRGSLRPYVGRLSLAQFTGVMEGVLAGLAHAESYGVVHRDLKPENLMVTGDGTVKIADFGIAKATQTVGTAEFLTAAGATVGTPRYMAPEQVMGQDIGIWTDLYSLGVMAWEDVVGRVPFHDSEAPMAIMMRHVNERIPPAVSVNPDADADISAWIDRLLVKDPHERARSPSATWEELEELVIQKLGPRWRREARLPSPSAVLDPPRPLTPAPFESQRSRAPQPVDRAEPEPVARKDPGHVTFGHAAESAPPHQGQAESRFALPHQRSPKDEPSLAGETGPRADAQSSARGVSRSERAISGDEPHRPEISAAATPDTAVPAPEPSPTHSRSDPTDATFGSAPDAVMNEPEVRPLESPAAAEASIAVERLGDVESVAGMARAATPEPTPVTAAKVFPAAEDRLAESDREAKGGHSRDVGGESRSDIEPASTVIPESPAHDDAGPRSGATVRAASTAPTRPDDAAEPTLRRDRAADGRPRTQRRRVRGSRPAVVLAIIAAAAVGVLVAPTTTRSVAKQIPLLGSASFGPIEVSVPTGWQREATPAVSYLKLANEVTLAPTGPNGGALVIGTATTSDPSLLPGTLLAAVSTAPTAQVVTLGHAQFFRYLDLFPRGAAAPDDVYALPTTFGTVIGACHLQGVGAGFPSDCEQVLGTLRLSGGSILGLGPSPTVAAELKRVITQLDSVVDSSGGRLRVARTPSDQARAAGELGAGYEEAASTIQHLVSASAADGPITALMNALRITGGDYAVLASAAAHNDKRGYDAARSSIASGATAIRSAFVDLSKLGYVVS